MNDLQINLNNILNNIDQYELIKDILNNTDDYELLKNITDELLIIDDKQLIYLLIEIIINKNYINQIINNNYLNKILKYDFYDLFIILIDKLVDDRRVSMTKILEYLIFLIQNDNLKVLDMIISTEKIKLLLNNSRRSNYESALRLLSEPDFKQIKNIFNIIDDNKDIVINKLIKYITKILDIELPIENINKHIILIDDTIYDKNGLNDMTVKQLQEIAKNMKLIGFYKFKKSELIDHILKNKDKITSITPNLNDNKINDDLSNNTVKQLQEIAKNMKLTGFYKLKKSELIDMITNNLNLNKINRNKIFSDNIDKNETKYDKLKLNMMTVKQLHELSKKLNLTAFYKLKKSELIDLILKSI